MSDPFDARVASVSPAAEGLVQVELEVPPEVASSFTAPGQYLKVTVPGAGDAYLAIASRPGAAPDRVELLLKLGGAVTDAIAKMGAGGAVKTTGAQGKGFPIERATGRDLVLVGTGSGISPLRSVIETVAARRSEFGKVSLYFGARTPGAMAYRERFDAWRAADVDVFPVVSRPQDTGWTGLTGYVQTHLAGVHIGSAVAFLCGQKGMVEAVKKGLAERGMHADAMFLNF